MSRHESMIRKLRNVESPEPPAALLDRIREDIPKSLEAAPLSRRDPVGARWWQLAAALVLFLGGGWLAWTWTRDPGAPRFDTAALEDPRAGRPADEGARTSATLEGRLDSAVPQAAPPATEPEIAAAGDERRIEVAPEGLRPKETTRSPAETRNELRAAPPAVDEGDAQRERQLRLSEAKEEGTLRKQASALQDRSRGIAGGVIGGVTEGVPGSLAAPPLPEAITVTSAAASQAPPSTGGTAEPNDQPYGDVFFRSHGVNPFIDPEDDRLSTFGLDVDTGSYTVARRYLSEGHLPPPEAIRVEEMINYFRYEDPAPAHDDFALTAEGAPWPFPRGERYYGLRFGIRAREVSVAERKPATLIFTVDVSGSMARENRLGLVRQALHLLLDQLDRGDRIGLVVYGSYGEVLLEPTSDHDAIRRAIDRLVPGGSTNAEQGLRLAYELASRHFRRGAINRVILCSDGVANVGATGPDSILERIGAEARRGIELTTIGFGMGNYNDVLMEQLANRGNGQYAYVDTIDEARRILVENLTGTLQTIARDAKVQVEFDPAAVARYRLLGYENRDVADHRFRDDTVDAGEIGAGHTVTALYEIKLHPGVSRNARVATLRLRYQEVDRGGRILEVERAVLAGELGRSWREASESFRLATLVAAYAELLKRSYWVRELDPHLVARRIGELDARDREVEELARLAATAAPLLERERRGRAGEPE